MRTVFVIAAVCGLQACQNSCQALCTEMASFKEECGAPASEAEIDACIDANASASGEDIGSCQTYGAAEVLRREWQCDDALLFDKAPPASK